MKNKAEGTEKAEIKKADFLAAGEACKAILYSGLLRGFKRDLLILLGFLQTGSYFLRPCNPTAGGDEEGVRRIGLVDRVECLQGA